MDELDIPMLDVGDFEVLDECEGEDDDEDQNHRHTDDDESEDDDDSRNHRFKNNRKLNDTTGDNSVLHMSIEVDENDFLENVATDLSNNFEDDVEKNSKEDNKPKERILRSGRKIQTQNASPKKSSPVKKEVEVIELSPEKIKPVPQPEAKNKRLTLKRPAPRKIEIDFSDEVKIIEKEETNEIKNEKIENNTNTKIVKVNEINNQNKPSFLKSDLTDDEIMMHFDEIENTVVNSDSLIIQNESDKSGVDQEKKEDKNIEADEEENWDDSTDNYDKKKKSSIKIEAIDLKEDDMWYKEKIQAKEEIVQEKFDKLASLIQYSYPVYKSWLDRNEALFNSAVCKIESSKYSPLNKLQTNRWKFICSKKRTPLSTTAEEENTTVKSENTTSSTTTEKKKFKNIWIVNSGVPDTNLENKEEYPPFVMRVVEAIKEFLQSTEETIEQNSEEKIPESEANQEVVVKTEETEEVTEIKPENDENVSSSENKESSSKKSNLDGVTLLLRSNRKNELMIIISGKNISTEIMDKLKDLFETNSDYNVKSLFCKSIVKENNVIRTNNKLLLGSEYLEENIGSIKISLTPKTNIWLNVNGVEVLEDVLTQYLLPTQKTSVVEIGCGAGYLSLMMASKCHRVVGIDVPKEIEEAKALCNLNEIKNVTFLTGKPKIFMQEVNELLSETKAVAVVNTNSAFGRSMDVILSLRKINTLVSIVIITSLTKQAKRSILELMQPADDEYGNPFMPIKACLVDTQPKGPSFEIVMYLQRRTMKTILKNTSEINPIGLISKSKMNAANKVINPAYKPKPPKFVKTFKTKGGFIQKKYAPNPYRPVSSKPPFNASVTVKKFTKKFARKGIPQVQITIGSDDKSREIDQEDLRSKLSSNRAESIALAKELNEQKKLLDAAKEKLISGVDVTTVKKLEEMISMAIEKTNKLESQLPPRSVWDRIAPAENSSENKEQQPMKGRLVKESGPKDIIITTTNREFSGSVSDLKHKPQSSMKSNFKITQTVINKPNSAPYHKPNSAPYHKHNSAPYHKPQPNRFQNESMRKVEEPTEPSWSRNQKNKFESLKRLPTSRPKPRPFSPPRKSDSPVRRGLSPVKRARSPIPRGYSPQRRPISPEYRQHSSRHMSPPRRLMSPPRRQSPPRRGASPNYRISPPRHMIASRKKSPPRRYTDEWDIPTRGAVETKSWSRQPEMPKEVHRQSSSSTGWNVRYTSSNEKQQNQWQDESRPQIRWDVPESFRKEVTKERNDWDDLPEDARDPWGDDNQDNRWSSTTQPSSTLWDREQPMESWKSKSSYPVNSMGPLTSVIGNNSMPNMNINPINNPIKPLMWQPQQPPMPQPIPQQMQPNRNPGWLAPPNNWQPQGNIGVGIGGNGPAVPMSLPSVIGNWQPQQTFATFPTTRPFNNIPYMSNRR